MPKKPAFEIPYLKPRAITDALRKQVSEELPEVAQIRDAALRQKVVEAWAFALAHSSFKSIRKIPPAGNPDTNEAKRGDQTDHLRGVTRLAVGIANEMGTAYPALAIDMDVIVAGGLVHDVGKAWEFDPVNRKRWKQMQKQTGRPSIRHPAFGAHICLTVGPARRGRAHRDGAFRRRRAAGQKPRMHDRASGRLYVLEYAACRRSVEARNRSARDTQVHHRHAVLGAFQRPELGGPIAVLFQQGQPPWEDEGSTRTEMTCSFPKLCCASNLNATKPHLRAIGIFPACVSIASTSFFESGRFFFSEFHV